jgi:hypothetical protein
MVTVGAERMKATFAYDLISLESSVTIPWHPIEREPRPLERPPDRGSL